MTIRQRPGHEVARAIKRAGVTQADIALVAKCSTSCVSYTIHRRQGVSDEKREAVWQAIEAAVEKRMESVA